MRSICNGQHYHSIDLTSYGCFPLLTPYPGTSTLDPYPSHRRYISSRGFCPSFFVVVLRHIASSASALTHLCLSRLRLNSEFLSDLKYSAGIEEREPWRLEVTSLPELVRLSWIARRGQADGTGCNSRIHPFSAPSPDMADPVSGGPLGLLSKWVDERENK